MSRTYRRCPRCAKRMTRIDGLSEDAHDDRRFYQCNHCMNRVTVLPSVNGMANDWGPTPRATAWRSAGRRTAARAHEEKGTR